MKLFPLNQIRWFCCLPLCLAVLFGNAAAAEYKALPQPQAQIVQWDDKNLCDSADLFADKAERARLQSLRLIYFGDPYATGTHSMSLVERQPVLNWRYYGVYKATEWSFQQGYKVFAPIMVNHGMDLRVDAGFWNPWNKQFMDIAQEMWFLPMQGWRQSGGLKEELDWAIARKIPVRVLCRRGSGYSLHAYHQGQ